MKRFAKIFLLLLLTVSLSYSQSDSVKVTVDQITNANLTADSLDEFKEIADSLTSQVHNAMQVIYGCDSLKENLKSQIVNCESRIGEKDLNIQFEKNVSSVYRKKYTFWKVVALISMGLNIYQVIRE